MQHSLTPYSSNVWAAALVNRLSSPGEPAHISSSGLEAPRWDLQQQALNQQSAHGQTRLQERNVTPVGCIRNTLNYQDTVCYVFVCVKLLTDLLQTAPCRVSSSADL